MFHKNGIFDIGITSLHYTTKRGIYFDPYRKVKNK